MSDKPTFDYDTMDAKGKADLWPDLARFPWSPADACLVQSLSDGHNREDTRRARWQHIKAKRELRREAMGAAHR